MSFKINPVEGTVAEIDVDLSAPSQHEREEFVIDEVKKAINHIVTALGGYLSVSCSGNINPVEGETGDVVNIYITSLPNPNPQTTTAPESAPEVQSGEPTPVTGESPQPQPPVTPDGAETPSTKQETSDPTQTIIAPENPAEVAPSVSPEENTASVGQVEAQEIAQATSHPIEPAV